MADYLATGERTPERMERFDKQYQRVAEAMRVLLTRAGCRVRRRSEDLPMRAQAIFARAAVLDFPVIEVGGRAVTVDQWPRFVAGATDLELTEAQSALNAVSKERRRPSSAAPSA